LTKALEDSVRAGHPWVFADAVRLEGDFEDGQVADLRDREGGFVARGTVEPRSPLVFRAWTTDADEEVGPDLVRRRLADALALRRATLDESVTALRVCHGENDHLPGLQCDLYGDVASLRTDGALGRAWESTYVEAVREVLQPRAVVVRNKKVARGRARRVVGDFEDPVTVREGERRYRVSVMHGMKTGFFIDQRPNRGRVQRLAAGRRVLDLFAYSGGFSVAAGLGGADQVTTVDQSRLAIEAAQANLEINGLGNDRHRLVCADVFEYLQSVQESFDLIVLDPPSFAPNKRSLTKAKRAYRRLNRLAMERIPPGGFLATASCSSHVDRRLFLEIIALAAADAGRRCTIGGVHGPGSDHPLRPGFPEGDYLSFVLLRIG
jgi:23S rRNA (cytosine1962-C5)-methyltransferase